ncbi:MAG: TetR/AcrR family transcriptional regulator [Proteobacteria bacterium]|nr:TetR/AcrR family transcriptional regulator [Pseudomonadota bacterium]
MAYRRTEGVLKRLAARRAAILNAARSIAAEEGMAGVQIVPVAARAGVAAGTVYRYFRAKNDLVSALIGAMTEVEIAAARRAGQAAPGPLSALTATLATVGARALRARRLTWALLAEPVDAEIDALQISSRRALCAEFETRVRAAVAAGHLPEQDAAFAAAAIVGALLGGLVGPTSPSARAAAERPREVVYMFTLLALRALGVVDARARGLVVQTDWPGDIDAA